MSSSWRRDTASHPRRKLGTVCGMGALVVHVGPVVVLFRSGRCGMLPARAASGPIFSTDDGGYAACLGASEGACGNGKKGNMP